jgi:hypothetical protein
MPQFRLSWFVFGPGVESGLPAIRSLGTFSTPTITTAPARLGNVRRESVVLDRGESIADDGLTADITTSMPGAQGTMLFPRLNASIETSSPSEATRTAEVEALRPLLARVTNVSKIETVLSLPGEISETKRREIYRRIAADLVQYLRANGGFLLQGLSVRLVPAQVPAQIQRAGSGIGVLLGLVAIAGVFAYVNRSPSPALSAAPCAPCARKKK